MAAWSYPGPRGQQQKQPRWYQPQWKSLAWATQLLVALDFFFVVMTRAPIVGDALWWVMLITTGLVLALVSILAVRR